MAIDPMIALSRATPEGEMEYQAFVSGLRQYWADLEPIRSQPQLAVHANGLRTLSRRDYHVETGTYRTYLVYRRWFIPFVVLGRYRVYETSRGALVFIGRHPLPTWARALNVVGAAGLGMLVYITVRIWLQVHR